MSEQDNAAATVSGAVSRRRALGLIGGVAASAGAAVLIGSRLDSPALALSAELDTDTVEFFGEHQAGITTPAQDRLHFAAFDVTTDRRDELIALLQEWSLAAARMTRGLEAGPLGAVGGPPEAPPHDTGEALGLTPANLTLTIGFGPSLFTDAKGRDRFGIADRRPTALADLPAFPGDSLDPARSGGDICIQACSDDPQVAVHAIRNLARIGFGTTSVRWSQLGFGRTASTSTTQATPRNLMGFKDGTSNLKAEDASLVNEHVWAQATDGSDWMVGGSYLVARRIRMTIETWDRVCLVEQENTFGRTKGEGGPLSGGSEFDGLDFTAVRATGAVAAAGAADAVGAPKIPMDAHVRLAHPSANQDARLLRRGYNFVDGTDGLGRLDAGLFFLAYQRDPRTAFVTVQRNLSKADALNEYIRHVGSAVFACPPGIATAPGDPALGKPVPTYWGHSLFS